MRECGRLEIAEILYMHMCMYVCIFEQCLVMTLSLYISYNYYDYYHNLDDTLEKWFWVLRNSYV